MKKFIAGISCIVFTLSMNAQRFTLTSPTTNATIASHYASKDGSHLNPALNQTDNKFQFSTNSLAFSNKFQPADREDESPKVDSPGDRGIGNLDTTIKADPITAAVVNKAGDSVNYTQKPFWVEIGSNFDLIDGPKPNNLFSGVFFYKRDIQQTSLRRDAGKNDTRPKNLAIFAGVFESKSVTSEEQQSFSLRQFYDSSSFTSKLHDSIKVFKGVGSISARRVVRNLGLFFSPQIRLTNQKADSDGLHVFASFWMELQWQQIETENVFSQFQKMDSSVVQVDSALNNPRFSNKAAKTVSDVRTHYFGFGLPIFFQQTMGENVMQLFLNPIIGITNQPRTDEVPISKIDPDFTSIRRKWSPFYVIQFRLNEENYGLSFTGEVRGLLRHNNAPYVSIALSKKFDLTKLIEFSK